MTVKEFYDWAKENDLEDYTLVVQYRDSGGIYNGMEAVRKPYIEVNEKALYEVWSQSRYGDWSSVEKEGKAVIV